MWKDPDIHAFIIMLSIVHYLGSYHIIQGGLRAISLGDNFMFMRVLQINSEM